MNSQKFEPDSQESIGSSFAPGLSQEPFSETFSRVSSKEISILQGGADFNVDDFDCHDELTHGSPTSSSKSNVSSTESPSTILSDEKPFSVALLTPFEHVSNSLQPQGDINLSPSYCISGSSPPNYTTFPQDEYALYLSNIKLVPFNKNVSDFNGIYGFSLNFGEKTSQASKNAPFTYSYLMKKLFANHRKKVPLKFTCIFQPQQPCWIRTTMVFTQPEDSNEIISRCPLHINDIAPKNIFKSDPTINTQHMVLADGELGSSVSYIVDEAGYQSTIVQYNQPCEGKYFNIIYTFMCLSTCSIIKRHSTALRFDLIDGAGQVLARQSVDLIISTCPGRDRGKAEQKRLGSATDGPSVKRRKGCSSRNGKENNEEYIPLMVHKDIYDEAARYIKYLDNERKNDKN